MERERWRRLLEEAFPPSPCSCSGNSFRALQHRRRKLCLLTDAASTPWSPANGFPGQPLGLEWTHHSTLVFREMQSGASAWPLTTGYS